jgi:hypothetical protein
MLALPRTISTRTSSILYTYFINYRTQLITLSALIRMSRLEAEALLNDIGIALCRYLLPEFYRIMGIDTTDTLYGKYALLYFI